MGNSSSNTESNVPLKIYQLSRIDGGAGFDETNSAIIIADSSDEAREILQDKNYGDECRKYPNFWLDTKLTLCVKIGISRAGLDKGIICLDFHNG